MQIAFHIGANCTDDDRLLKSILKNGPALSDQNIKAPGPSNYRRLIRETIQNLNGAEPAENTRQILLDSILDDDTPDRLVMSNADFICIPNRIFDKGVFYDQAAFKVSSLVRLFPNDEISLFMGMRDPASFLPDAFARSKETDFGRFLHGMPLGDIRWSDVVTRIRQAAPNASLTVWCNEDTPLIWAQLVRQISGLSRTTNIAGGFDLLTQIMSPQGMKRLIDYLRDSPPKTESQRRKIIMAFLAKYALEDQIEDEVDLPGMDALTLAQLTAQYDQDVDRIAAMPDVTFIDV